MGSIDLVSSALGHAWLLIRNNFKGLFIDFLKIYGLYFLLDIIWLAIAAVIGLAFIGFNSNGFSELLRNPGDHKGAIILLILIEAILALLFSAVMIAIRATLYNAVEERINGKKLSVTNKSMELVVPAGIYNVIMWVLILIVFGVPALIFLVMRSPGGSLFGLTSFVLAIIIAFIVWILLAFFIQFAMVEIAINKKGAIESIKSSFSLVRRNIAATLVFDIALFVAAFAIAMVFSIFRYVLQFLILFAAFSVILVPIVIVLYLIVALLESTTIAVVMIPMQYYFWKRLASPQTEEKTAAAQTAILKEPERAVSAPPKKTLKKPSKQ